MNKKDSRIQKWRALQPWERHVLIKLFFLLPVAWLVLLLFGFKRGHRMAEFELPSVSEIDNQASVKKAQRHAELTAIAARHGLYKANCLHQSIALCWLLRKQGLFSQIRIGVLPNTKPLQAHAWVELDGLALGQTVDQYKAFDRLNSDPDKVRFV